MNPQLEALLNQLLEAERAGRQLLDAMTHETADPQIKALFANFTDIEVGDAAVLEGLIHLHGGTPSTKTSDFADRVLRIENPPADIAAFLKEMANRHRHNMEWARAEAIKAFDE